MNCPRVASPQRSDLSIFSHSLWIVFSVSLFDLLRRRHRITTITIITNPADLRERHHLEGQRIHHRHRLHPQNLHRQYLHQHHLLMKHHTITNSVAGSPLHMHPNQLALLRPLHPHWHRHNIINNGPLLRHNFLTTIPLLNYSVHPRDNIQEVVTTTMMMMILIHNNFKCNSQHYYRYYPLNLSIDHKSNSNSH